MDALVDFLLNFYGPTPYFLIFGILLLCGFGLPMPEDVVLFAGGLLAYYGVCELWIVIVISFCGVMAGDAVMFILGRRYGRQLTQFWFFKKLLPEERLLAASQRFRKKGGKRLLFAARFMPGFRAPMFFSAGLLHIPFRKFFFMDGLAALISVPTIVGAVFYFGDELDQVVRFVKRVEHGILFVVIGVILLIGTKWWWVTQKRLRQGSGV